MACMKDFFRLHCTGMTVAWLFAGHVALLLQPGAAR
jgi:hypothetical protein